MNDIFERYTAAANKAQDATAELQVVAEEFQDFCGRLKAMTDRLQQRQSHLDDIVPRDQTMHLPSIITPLQKVADSVAAELADETEQRQPRRARG